MASYDSYDSLTKALKQDGYENALGDFKNLAGSTQKLVYNDWATNRNVSEIADLLTDNVYNNNLQTAVRDYMRVNNMQTEYAQLMGLSPTCQANVAVCWQQGSTTFDTAGNCATEEGNPHLAYSKDTLQSLIKQAKRNNCVPCSTPECHDAGVPLEALVFVIIAAIGLWIVGSNPKSIL